MYISRFPYTIYKSLADREKDQQRRKHLAKCIKNRKKRKAKKRK